MKQKEYLKKVLKQVDYKGQILCDECGEIDKLGHVIIDHSSNTVKMVCQKCFVSKYQDRLYGKIGDGSN